MAAIAFASSPVRRTSLATIDRVVSARLGPTRVPGNEQPACFNRQIAMYLARHVGGWSTTQIGRFYNGRDHSTVCHGIQRIESIRESDPEVDILLTQLKQQLASDCADTPAEKDVREFRTACSGADLDEVADRIAQRIWAYFEERLQRQS
jgi:hypothetical protein